MPQFDVSNFWVLNWYYILAIIISASALLVGIKNYRKRKNHQDSGSGKSNDQQVSSLFTNNPSISITNNVNTTDSAEPKYSSALPTVPEEKIKSNVKILFIDDNHAEYKMVSILKKAGWINTRAVKDVIDLHSHLILESDIIFVDINGVGTTMFEDQGLGLASALKSKHPTKKVVIYSAETTGDRFHKALRQVDDCLAKNAEPYQFIDLVESLSKK